MVAVEITVSLWFLIVFAGTVVFLVLTKMGRNFACYLLSTQDVFIIAAAILMFFFGIYWFTGNVISFFIAMFLTLALLISFLLRRTGLCPI